MRIGFIGAGNMATAIISGILESKYVNNKDIFVNSRTTDKVNDLESKYNINPCDNKSNLVNKVDIIVLAVKPTQYKNVIDVIKDCDYSNKVVVSIAAGLSIDKIRDMFDKDIKIVRCMPNTPVSVGEGMTGICCNGLVTDVEIKNILNMFETIGKAEIVDEKCMDAVVAVSGSSPAYIYILIEAMADAAVMEGLSREKAYKFAAQSVLGSAKMVLETGIHPGELKDKVCSPSGTTIEAVKVLEDKGFRSSVIEAMSACADKSRKLS